MTLRHSLMATRQHDKTKQRFGDLACVRRMTHWSDDLPSDQMVDFQLDPTLLAGLVGLEGLEGLERLAGLVGFRSTSPLVVL